MSYTRFFKKAGATRTLVPIKRFIDSHLFSTGGGHGLFLKVPGIDGEGLDRVDLDGISDRLSEVFGQLPESVTVYQYALVRKGYKIPSLDQYPSESAVRAERQRIAHLEQTGSFRSVALCWCVYIASDGRKPGVRISELRRAASTCIAQLSGVLDMEYMNEHEVTAFLEYLLYLDTRRVTGKLASRENVDKQLSGSQIKWTSDGLIVGKQIVQPFSMIKRPKGTRPGLLYQLLCLPYNMVICMEWRRASSRDASGAISTQESALGWFRLKFGKVAAEIASGSTGNPAKDDSGTKVASKRTDRLGDIALDIDNGLVYGKFSIIGIVHSRDRNEVDEAMGNIETVFSDPSQARVAEEDLGSLAAYLAMLPGNGKFNVRRRWIRQDHAANLSFVYQSNLGFPWSDALDSEYHVIYETRDGTPYFDEPYVGGGLRGRLVVGKPRTGKSVNGNYWVDHDAKYGGITTIYDIGGSYDTTVLSHGGVVTKVGIDGPRFNPWSQPESDRQVHGIFLLVRLMLQRGGYALKPEEEDDLVNKVRMVYRLDENVRCLRSLILPAHIRPRLRKWVHALDPRERDGIYARIFDNPGPDQIQLAKMQSFDFAGVGEDYRDMMEPTLFWLARIKEQQRMQRDNIMLPKHDVFDEIWKQIEDPRMWDYILNDLKTAGKVLGGVTLLTHHIDDLGDRARIIKNSCSSFLFLPDKGLDRKLYRDFFGLNDTELDLIAAGKPREAVLKTPTFTKVVILNLDQETYFKYSTKPKDICKREALVDEHGVETALKMLAANSKN